MNYFAVAVQGAREAAEPYVQAYLVRSVYGRYLERLPYDGSWGFLATTWQHATPVSLADAQALLQTFPEAAIVPDGLSRAPIAVK